MGISNRTFYGNLVASGALVPPPGGPGKTPARRLMETMAWGLLAVLAIGAGLVVGLMWPL